MSDERQNKQDTRDPSASAAKTKTALTYGLIVVLLAGAYLGGRYHRNHKYDSFAKCLAARQTKMYGLSWCSHCADQKAMFGAAFHYVPYVECGIKETKEETPECKAAGLNLFPTWQFGIEPRKAGVLSLEALSDQTGCSLP
jgi:hypothetical protein